MCSDVYSTGIFDALFPWARFLNYFFSTAFGYHLLRCLTFSEDLEIVE